MATNGVKRRRLYATDGEKRANDDENCLTKKEQYFGIRVTNLQLSVYKAKLDHYFYNGINKPLARVS